MGPEKDYKLLFIPSGDNGFREILISKKKLLIVAVLMPLRHTF
jgi:hypothetical protein